MFGTGNIIGIKLTAEEFTPFSFFSLKINGGGTGSLSRLSFGFAIKLSHFADFNH